MAKKITRNQKRAIEALLITKTIDEAAAKAGISRRTLNRWLSEDDNFRVARLAAESAAIDKATRRLISLLDQATDAFEDVLQHPEVKGANTKRLTAVSIVDSMQKMRDLRNVEDRLAALEEYVYDQKNSNQD